jgi:hypothetical protein
MPDVTIGTITVSSTPTPGQPGTPAQPPQIQSQLVPSLAQLQAAAPYVRTPGFLPQGLQFRQGAVVTAPRQLAVLTYVHAATGASLSIVQAPASQYHPQQTGQPTYFVVADSLTPSSIEAVAVARAQRLLRSQPDVVFAIGLVAQRSDLLVHATGIGIAEAEVGQIVASI